MASMQDQIAEYNARKEELKANKNRVVRRPIPKLHNDIVPRKTKGAGGRKRKYTPQRMKNGINKYFEWCEATDTIPSIKGLTIYLKLYPDAFYKYIKEPAFNDILEQARLIIVNWAEEDVYNTQGMAASKIAYMKNVHTWADKLDTHNINENTNKNISVDEARAKIEQLAPMLLDVLKNSEVVKQIAVDAELVEEQDNA